MKIYIVRGTTGEYSDRTEWPVCAYFDKTKADEHAVAANLAAGVCEEWRDKDDAPWISSDDPNKPTNPYDPNMDMAYFTGTSYATEEVEIKDTPQ